MPYGRTSIAMGLALIVALTLGCASGPSAIRSYDPPAAAGGALPRLAVTPDGALVAGWVEPSGDGHQLRVAELGPDGWEAPHTVARGDDWMINWADAPSIAVGERAFAAHWLVRRPSDSPASDVVVAVSTDRGLSWSEPVVPHRDGTPTEHGFATLVPDGGGGFVAVWLDGRERATQQHGSRPAPMTLRTTTVDRLGGAGDADARLDDRVCDCCGTAAALSDEGTVIVAFRDRSDEEIRDISVVRRVGGVWDESRIVHDDGWRIAACPVNGPAIASRGSTTVVAWFTGAGSDGPEVRVAFSDDDGRSFAPPIRVDDGDALGRVDVALRDDGTALVLWLARRENAGRLMLRAIGAAGAVGEPRGVTGTRADRSSGFPKIAETAGGTFVAWTDGEGPDSRVRIGRLEEAP